MPGGPRSNVVRKGEVATYHVWSRCAQGAFLMGRDPVTDQDFSHRKAIFEKLIGYQAGVFAIDVGSYGILDNHFHSGLRTRPDVVERWSDEEVAWRWKRAWPSIVSQVARA